MYVVHMVVHGFLPHLVTVQIEDLNNDLWCVPN